MQEGLRRFWFSLCVLQVGLLTVTLVYHVYYVYRSVLILEAVELLQKQTGHVDVSLLAACEQVAKHGDISIDKQTNNKWIQKLTMANSTAYSLSTWCDALPPHAEVCDSAEGVQDDGHTCCAPRWLAVQAFLANGKLKQTLEVIYLWYRTPLEAACMCHTF